MGIFAEIFTWWGGNTIGHRFTLWKQGRFVGEDDQGNKYYEQARGVGPLGRPRRWVVYSRLAEASLIPPGWYGWMHYKSDLPPTEEDYKPRAFQAEHRPNYTGTALRYRPNADIRDAGQAVATDYEPWKPE